MSTYCLNLYGSSLWNYSKDRVNNMFVAWRKVVRKLLPNMTHCNLLSTINSFLPIEIALEKRCAKPKLIHSCLNSNNMIIKSTSISALTTYRSQFGDNYRYICYKYKIPRNSCFYQLLIYYSTSILMVSLSNIFV